MKILVTGGAGFIGSHLCLHLLQNGNDVVAFDNLSLGKEKFLVPCLDFKNFKFIKADLLDLEEVKKACRGVDQIWHLAANSDIASGGEKTDVDLYLGTMATYNVLEAARLGKIKEFVFSSTSAVYGEALKKPTPEDYGPLLPISLYGASKLACEGLVTAFGHCFDMKVWIFRFANIVGSHTTHGAIHDFIKKLKHDPKTLEILGNGKQNKSYLHVTDCLAGMEFGVKEANDPINLFNLASRGQCSVDQIADTVIEAFNLRVEKKYTGGERGWPGDVSKVLLDGSRLQAKGFVPRFESVSAVSTAVKDILADSERGIS